MGLELVEWNLDTNDQGRLFGGERSYTETPRDEENLGEGVRYIALLDSRASQEME